MLPYKQSGSGGPALLLMPFLGGTQAEWNEVIPLLTSGYRCFSLDLPGFGAAAEINGYSVDEMADQLIETVQYLRMQCSVDAYVLVGHSMAGKVSAVVARKLLSGSGKVEPPSALILVCPSPPGPEPMTEAKRAEMLAMFGAESRATDLSAANEYITVNVSTSLPAATMEQMSEDVLTMNKKAWRAWLEHGSKEDWSKFVGVIDLPVLVVAGMKDNALGPTVQREVTMPHFSAANLVELACNHLAPIEKPGELAHVMLRFLLGVATLTAEVNCQEIIATTGVL